LNFRASTPELVKKAPSFLAAKNNVLPSLGL
jgi:hypothetical protein